jgi:hypothetical protein
MIFGFMKWFSRGLHGDQAPVEVIVLRTLGGRVAADVGDRNVRDPASGFSLSPS